MQYCVDIPGASHLRLANATVPVCCLPAGASAYTQTVDSLALVNIDIIDGQIRHIHAAHTQQQPLQPQWALVNLKRGMVLPTFVDLHTHIGGGFVQPHLLILALTRCLYTDLA